jgi:hypothetical protein
MREVVGDEPFLPATRSFFLVEALAWVGSTLIWRPVLSARVVT